jgi:hypothetical protein
MQVQGTDSGITFRGKSKATGLLTLPGTLLPGGESARLHHQSLQGRLREINREGWHTPSCGILRRR